MTSAEEGDARLRVTREPQRLRDRWRVYQVVLDGATVGKLRPDESVELAVSNGTHDVWVKIDWCRSRKLSLSFAAGERIELDCRGQGSIVQAAIRSLTKPSEYLELERLTPGG